MDLKWLLSVLNKDDLEKIVPESEFLTDNQGIFIIFKYKLKILSPTNHILGFEFSIDNSLLSLRCYSVIILYDLV